VLPGAVIRLTPDAKTCPRRQDAGKAHIKNRNFVSRRWKRTPAKNQCCCSEDPEDMDYFLNRIKSHGCTVTAMAFQDAYTLDIERLRQCSLHVYEQGRLIPFCARYITGGTAKEKKYE
jgi:hypothetical protein